MKRIFLIVSFAVLPFILSGCIPTTGGGDKTGSQEYMKGAVVSSFPPLPLYPKSKIVESYNFNNNYGASFISTDKLDKVVSFYSDSLGKLGWDHNLYKQSETNYVYEVKNEEYKGSVIINTAGDGKSTALTFSLKPKG